MFRRNVQSIQDLLQKYLRDEGLETPLLQKRIIAAWEAVAGPTVTAYTGDKFIKNQTLYVKITNPSMLNCVEGFIFLLCLIYKISYVT